MRIARQDPVMRLAVVATFSFGLCFAACLLAVPLPDLAKLRVFATDAQLGLMGTIGMFCYTAGVFAVGRIADRVGFRVLFAAACAVFAVFAALFPLLRDLPQFIAVNAVFSLGQAIFWPVLMGWMSSTAAGAELPGVMMAFNLGWSSAQLGGDYLGGVCFEWHPHLAFYLAAGIGLLFLAVTLLLPRRLWQRRTDTPDPAAEDAGVPPPPDAARFLWIAWSASLVSVMLLWGVRWLFPPLALGLGIAPRLTGLVLAAMPAVQIGAFVLLGRWHGWHYRLWPLVVATLLAAAGCALAAVTRHPLGFAVAFMLIGLYIGLAYTSSLYYSVHGRTDAARRASLHEGIAGIGAIAGPALFGLVAQHRTPQTPYGVSTVILLVLLAAQLAFSLLWRRRARTREYSAV